MQDWSSMNPIVTPAVRRGFCAAFRDFNWEACSRFLMVYRHPPAMKSEIAHLWVAYSDATIPQIHQANWTIHSVGGDTWSPTSWHILHVILYYHVYPCIGAAVWIGYSDWHLRAPQHPVASIQPLNGQWLLPDTGPDPHWTTSPSLLTNMLKFRSTPRTWVQNCTIWLTVSNNGIHWWPVLPGRCGSLLVLRDFGKFLRDPTSLLWAVSLLWSLYWDTISIIILIPEL